MKQIAEVLAESLMTPVTNMGDRKTIVDAVFYVGEGLHKIAGALRALGTGDAATTMGALECVAMEIRGLAAAVRERETES